MRADELCFTYIDFHAVPFQLIMNNFQFMLSHVGQFQTQILHRDPTLAAVPFAVHIPMTIAGQIQNSFSHGLRRNRPLMQADAPHATKVAFNNGNTLPQLRSSDRRLLTGRTTSNNNNVVFHRTTLNTSDSLPTNGTLTPYVKMRRLAELFYVNEHL